MHSCFLRRLAVTEVLCLTEEAFLMRRSKVYDIALYPLTLFIKLVEQDVLLSASERSRSLSLSYVCTICRICNYL
jgi:hypothetical protein